MVKIFQRHSIRWLVLCGGMLIIGVLGFAFSKKNHAVLHANQKFAVAQIKNQSVDFYFKGSLLPIRTISVLSPVDGVVQQVYFTYGAHVRKGQPLVSIQSVKLVETFRTAVGNFLATSLGAPLPVSLLE